MMFAALRQRARDMAGIAALCCAAETIARTEGEGEPAAEHFLLAALQMEDGSAARAWAALGQTRDTLREAIEGQYTDALASVGVDAAASTEALPETPPPGPFRASGSGQALLQAMAMKEQRTPFRSVEVLAAAATLRHGVVPRALRRLGITPEQLASLR